jgi:hypothetical protein
VVLDLKKASELCSIAQFKKIWEKCILDAKDDKNACRTISAI